MQSKGSHYQIVVCVLVLIAVNIPEAWTQNIKVPQSPCPRVFNYASSENYYLGYGKLTDIPIGTNILLEAELIIEGTLPETNSAEIKLVGDLKENVDKIYLKQPVNFLILFPTQDPLPLISSITMNNRVICQGPPAPEYSTVTILTLKRLLKPNTPPNYQPTLMPKHIAKTTPRKATQPTTTTITPMKNQNSKGPQSPCPSVFIYTSNKNYHYGYGELTDIPIGTNIILKAKLIIIGATINENNSAKIKLVGDLRENVDKIYLKQPVNFLILFPTQNVLPLISSITMNNRVVCQGPSTSEYTAATIVTLQYTLEPNTPLNYQPTLMPKPIAKTTPRTPTTTKPMKNFNIGCGKIPKLFTNLAFGGTTIDKGQWPWLVAIHNNVKSFLSYRCAGTIISKTTVLSAAHCFYRRKLRIKTEDITLFLGHHNLNQLQEEGSRIINVDSIIIHPEYNPEKFFADIAITKFPQVIEYSVFIQPVCLWNGSPDINRIVGQVGSLVGWGRDENGNIFTPEPKRVQVPIVSEGVCLRSHEAFTKITNENTFCGGWRNGTDGPCTGDSGTGLMMNKGGIWYIRGIVSSSISDPVTLSCDLHEFVSFTDVAKFTDWIQSKMS